MPHCYVDKTDIYSLVPFYLCVTYIQRESSRVATRQEYMHLWSFKPKTQKWHAKLNIFSNSLLQAMQPKLQNPRMKIFILSSNVSTTPLRQWGFRQCLPFSWTTLRGKYCRHPIILMGVADTFGLRLFSSWNSRCIFLRKWKLHNHILN